MKRVVTLSGGSVEVSKAFVLRLPAWGVELVGGILRKVWLHLCERWIYERGVEFTGSA